MRDELPGALRDELPSALRDDLDDLAEAVQFTVQCSTDPDGYDLARLAKHLGDIAQDAERLREAMDALTPEAD